MGKALRVCSKDEGIGNTKMALAGEHTLGHSGGAREVGMSPGSTWLPLGPAAT